MLQPTIKHSINYLTEELGEVSHTASLDIELLIAHILKKERSHVLANPEQILSENQRQQLHQLAKRRKQGEPIAYILGHKEFYGLNFIVTPDTLIPRPETELLVDIVLEKLPADGKCTIADLGTGCGAIAIAIAKQRPNWIIYATDNNQQALDVAAENAKNLRITNVKFILSDWYNNLPQVKFNVIVSNPPYIAVADPDIAPETLAFEPKAALIAAENGLAELRNIITQAKSFLLAAGFLLLEHGHKQSAAVIKMLQDANYRSPQALKDLSGIKRATIAWQQANG